MDPGLKIQTLEGIPYLMARELDVKRILEDNRGLGLRYRLMTADEKRSVPAVRDIEDRNATPLVDTYKESEQAAVRTLVGFKTDPRTLELLDLTAEFEDGFEAADDRSLTGGKRARGGAKKPEAVAAAQAVESPPAAEATEAAAKDKIKAAVTDDTKSDDQKKAEVAKVIAANPGVFAKIVQTALSKKAAAQRTAAVIGVGIALNRPTFYGNLVRVLGVTLRTALDAAVTSTYSEWGQFGVDVLTELGLTVETVGNQILQGPVVPVVLATAWLAYRATQTGTSIKGLLASYASKVRDGAAGIIAREVAAFKAELAAQVRNVAAPQLAEIAQKVRDATVAGRGAAEMSAAVRSLGAPAVGSTGVVPGYASPAPASALDRIVNAADAVLRENKDGREAMAVAGLLLELHASTNAAPGANAAAAPGAPPPPGGRRRRRKTKRKAPKRRRAVTRKVLTFVY